MEIPIEKVKYRILSKKREGSPFKKYDVLKAHFQDISNRIKSAKPEYEQVWIYMFSNAGDLIHALDWIVEDADTHKKEIEISETPDFDVHEKRLVNIVARYCNFRAAP